MTDIGGLDDRSFNFLANKGLSEAKLKLKIQGRVFVSKSNADYVPNLSAAARGGYNLVISVGFLMGDATAAVAKRFPKTKFAIIDNSGVAKRAQGQAEERPRPALQGAGSRLPRRLPRRAQCEERPEQPDVIAAVGGSRSRRSTGTSPGYQ